MCALFEEALGDRYFLQTPGKCPELGLLVTQIRKKGTVARRKYDWQTPAEQCGISIDKFNDIKVGDIIEAYTMEEVKRD